MEQKKMTLTLDERDLVINEAKKNRKGNGMIHQIKKFMSFSNEGKNIYFQRMAMSLGNEGTNKEWH